MLTLSVLGYPTVSHGSSVIADFISQKALVLFSYLVLEPRAHSREALAGLFWGEMPQERALSNLRQALHNIQKQIPDALIITRQTAQFNAAYPHTIDVMCFDQPSDVIEIYRDEFMAGVTIPEAEALEEWIGRQRAHYRQRYEQHLEQAIAEALSQRDAAHVERLARRFIAHDPYRETTYHALWRALVAQHNIHAALLSVEALRARLHHDLGTELSPQSQRLAHHLTLAQTAARHNIPTSTSTFVGRAAEIARVQQYLAQPQCRLITLLGMGGVGKSRLAQEVGRLQAEYYLNGVRYVPLEGITDALSLVSTVADALGLSLQNVRDPQQTLETFLKEREMLLIFDNAEYLTKFASWLATLMRALPTITIIVTSRHRLALREEWVLPVEGLPADMLDSASVHLLVQSAHQQGRNFQPDAEAVNLCILLDGLPLALELAGALLTERAGVLLAQIQANLDSLQAQWINAEPRHRSLRAVFLTSWHMLSPTDQAALAKLAVFGGSFTTQAAYAVAAADEALLHRLASRSLVRAEGSRWSLHPVIRTYADEFQTEREILSARFEAFYLDVLTQAERLFAAREIVNAVETVRGEIAHIRRCWQNALNHAHDDRLVQMSFTLHRFYEGIGWYPEGLAFFQTSLDTLISRPDTPPAVSGRLKAHETGMLLRLGRTTEALGCAQEAVNSLSHNEDEPDMLAFALNSLGITQLYTGDTHMARITLEQCAAIYRQLERDELVKPLVNLGAIHTRTGDIQNARATLQEAYAIAQRMGDQTGAYHITNGLGVCHMLLSDYGQASRFFEEALTLSQQTGFLQGQAVTLNNLGDVYTLTGHADLGQTYAEQAVALARQLQDQRSLIYALTTLTLARLALRQPDAAPCLREALEQAYDSAAPMQTMALYAAGEWYLSVGQPADAHLVWVAIAEHPATEMDYRRRIKHRLENIADRTYVIVPLDDLIAKTLAQLA